MSGIEGRALHLLDVEYLGCGPTLSPADLALILEHYRAVADWTLGDHLVGAASNWTYEHLAWDVPSDLRLLPAGAGPDAADLRLIDEATHVIDLTRYDRIVVASGDPHLRHRRRRRAPARRRGLGRGLRVQPRPLTRRVGRRGRRPHRRPHAGGLSMERPKRHIAATTR
jgi:hypothetical protein